MSRIISWCFYVSEDVSRLGEYLVGLKYNIAAARLWFPGWEYRLYYASNLNAMIWDYIVNICQDVILIPIREGYAGEIERYLPLFENHEIVMVRDIDSILSKTDADLVNQWIETPSRVLQYQEHLMYNHYCMGGGVAIKGRLEGDYIKPMNYTRGDDEDVLSTILSSISLSERTIIITRMSKTGIYYIKSHHILLWPVPFYDAPNGMLYDYPNLGILKYDVEKIVGFASRVNINPILIHSHANQYQFDFYLEWHR